jgi:glycosyltransferase involved in cell wall biosynthesis
MVKASIIIPTFDSAPYLELTLQSALAQTYEDVEIIVVDDGSTDNTCEVVHRFVDPRITFIRQLNSGPSAARNTGIENSSGEFIQFLDSDDLILPEKLATQIALLKHHAEYGLVYSNACYFEDESPKDLYPLQLEALSGDVLQALVTENIMPSHAPLIRRACFDRTGLFYEPLRAVEDWDMWLRLAYAGVLFLHQNEMLALYRRRSQSRSSHTRVVWESEIEVLRRFEEYADSKTLSRVPLAKALAHRYLGLALLLYYHGDSRRGLEMLSQSKAVLGSYFDDVGQVAHFLANQALGIERHSEAFRGDDRNIALNLFCDALSQLVPTGKAISKRAQGIYWHATMFLNHEQNDLKGTRKSFLRTLRVAPDMLYNWGTFSILAQSLLGHQCWESLYWLRERVKG